MSCVISNNGTINLNQPITADAIEAFRKELRANNLPEENYTPILLAMISGKNTIEINDYYDRAFNDTCKHLVNALKPLGYKLNARIQYYGDYDGCTYIENNIVSEADIKDCWKHDATDEELIKILESRRYDMDEAKRDMKRRYAVREAIARGIAKTEMMM